MMNEHRTPNSTPKKGRFASLAQRVPVEPDLGRGAGRADVGHRRVPCCADVDERAGGRRSAFLVLAWECG